MTQEALKLAHWSDCSVHSEPAYPKGECDCGGIVAVADYTALSDKYVALSDKYVALKARPPQTQEPVQFKCTVIDDVHPSGIPLEQWTSPPQRTWVGLTEDEAFACQGRDYFETYKAIEAKLKEKNT